MPSKKKTNRNTAWDLSLWRLLIGHLSAVTVNVCVAGNIVPW